MSPTSFFRITLRSPAPTCSTNRTLYPQWAPSAFPSRAADGFGTAGGEAGPQRRIPVPAGSARHSAGRHPGSDIFLDDVTVSRRHAEFRWENDEFHVVDVGSLYGTYVNREAVDSAVLVDGDEVQIGKFRLVFLTGAQDRWRHRVTGLANDTLDSHTGFRLSRFRDNGSGRDRG